MSPLILLGFTLWVWGSIMYTLKTVVSSKHFQRNYSVCSLDPEGFLASVFIWKSGLFFILTLHPHYSFLSVIICLKFILHTFMHWSWPSQAVWVELSYSPGLPCSLQSLLGRECALSLHEKI